MSREHVEVKNEQLVPCAFGNLSEVIHGDWLNF